MGRGHHGGQAVGAFIKGGGWCSGNPRWEYGVRRGSGMTLTRNTYHADPQCTFRHFPPSRIPLWQRASSPRISVIVNHWGAGEGGADPVSS